MKKAVIYLRVSTPGQAETDYDPEGYSIPAQREACQRKAESLDAEVIEEFLDMGESARSADRPRLQDMLELLKHTKAIDFVIVHKVDRLARSRTDDVQISLVLHKAGAKLVSVSENIDETPSGQLLHGILATVAEFYSNNLATEVIKGMTRKAQTGGTPGKVPPGYLNVHEVLDNRVINTVALDPDRAHYIKEAFELYSSGNYSLVQLADMMSAKGFLTRGMKKAPKRPAYANLLSKVLNNSYYCGFVTHRGVLYEGRHEALISRELFEKVRTVLQARLAGEKQRRYLHYLKGSIFCARCGSRLCIASPNQDHLYYFCAARPKRHACNLPFLPIANIEQRVTDYYRNVRLTEIEASNVRAAIYDYLEGSRELAAADAKRQEGRLARLEQERAKLMEAYYANAVTLDFLSKEQQRINRETDEIKSTLGDVKKDHKIIAENLELALSLVGDPSGSYRKAPDLLRRLMNQAIFEDLSIDQKHDDGSIVVIGSHLAEPFRSLLALSGRSKELVEKIAYFSPKQNKTEGLEFDGSLLKEAQASKEDLLVRVQGLKPWASSLARKRSIN